MSDSGSGNNAHHDAPKVVTPSSESLSVGDWVIINLQPHPGKVPDHVPINVGRVTNIPPVVNGKERKYEIERYNESGTPIKPLEQLELTGITRFDEQPKDDEKPDFKDPLKNKQRKKP